MRQPEDMTLEEMQTKSGAILDQDGITDPEVMELAALSLLEYEKVRAEMAKEMGVRVTILDDLVKAARSMVPVPKRR